VILKEASRVPALEQYSASLKALKRLQIRFCAGQHGQNSSSSRLAETCVENTALSLYMQQLYRPIAHSRPDTSSVSCLELMESQPLILFGRKVRAVRDAADISRELAAEKSGITANYLGEVERGEKWPSLEIICAIATALSVSPSIFFDFESQETDPGILTQKLHRIIQNRTTEQQQQALRVLKGLLEP
jgi:transcriptional regulator with XRE-family HTH domain